MRVLISAPGLSPGKNVSGISSVAASIIDGLRDYACFVHLKAGRSDMDRSGVIGYLALIFSLVSFPWLIYRKRINLFHQNVPLNTKGVIREFLFSTVASLCHVPILVHLHGGVFIDEQPRSKWLYKMTRQLLLNARQVIVLSSYETNQLTQLYQIESVILKNAVDTKRFHMKQAVYGTSLPVLLFLGRIHEEKGLNEMAEAFSQMADKKLFRFVMCGAGPQKDFFVQRFQEILGDSFIFKGVVSGEQKVEIIRQSDFFILPSYSEGLPISLLENMSCGVVPVVSDDEALLHVVTDSVNGFIVKKKSSVDLSKKLGSILALSPQEYRNVSLNARASVEEKYALDNYNNKLLMIYKNMLSN
ncbi:MAG: glycosyltransferase family 4 protein [Bacteroidales bacterium]|nr:glycosyltransferase family 4 protein [Bacteroidales bacterium]